VKVYGWALKTVRGCVKLGQLAEMSTAVTWDNTKYLVAIRECRVSVQFVMVLLMKKLKI